VEDFLIEKVSASPQETFVFGEYIAGLLKPGCVIALRGSLGSGKTCLAKGIARGLGITETITSPTYTIISEYSGSSSSSVTLYHIDAYRLDSDEDFEQIGGPELISGKGISIIEWSERIPKSLPQDAICIDIEITGPQARVIRVCGPEAGP
jgi:tRNA threonylcarbamoyladenosine biosynthesis protein TsaE